MVREIDVDGSGKLDEVELLKLLRVRRELDLRQARRLFKAADKDGSGALDRLEVSKVLRRLGQRPTAERLDQAYADAGVSAEEEDPELDFEDFLFVWKKLRAAAVENFRRCAGFSAAEVEQFQEKFDKYDRDKSGDIQKAEMRRLLEDIYPSNQKIGPSDRARLATILQEIDESGDGTTDFYEFLTLMRQFQDARDEETLAREAEAVEVTGFSHEEVEGFRAIFKTGDFDRSKKLSVFELKQIFSKLIRDLDNEGRYKQLVALIEENSGESGAPLTDFPHFLRLMHHAQTINFLGINDRSAALASSYERRAGGSRVQN